MAFEHSWSRPPRPEELAPEEIDLSQAQAQLARAIDATRRAGQAYFAAALHESVPAREAYYDALTRQAAAERAFYDAKNALARNLNAHRRLKRP